MVVGPQNVRVATPPRLGEILSEVLSKIKKFNKPLQVLNSKIQNPSTTLLLPSSTLFTFY